MEKMFNMVPFENIYNASMYDLNDTGCSKELCCNAGSVDMADGEFWGIPFSQPTNKKDVLFVPACGNANCIFPSPIKGKYLVFMHMTDVVRPGYGDGFCYPFHGMDDLDRFLDVEVHKPYEGVPRLGTEVCKYTIYYEDGTSEIIPVTLRRNIGEWSNPMHQCYECVPHIKALSFDTISDEQRLLGSSRREYGFSLFHTDAAGAGDRPIFWLYSWNNPKPDVSILRVEIHDVHRNILISGITACNTSHNPLRWNTRKKMLVDFNQPILALNELDRSHILEKGLILNLNIAFTMGQVICIRPVLQYPNEEWTTTSMNLEPEILANQYIIEYSAHEDACIILGTSRIPLKQFLAGSATPVEIDDIDIHLKIVDGDSRLPIPVRLHLHGENGEYLAPQNRTRIPNPHWFQDYSTEYVLGQHQFTYVDGDVQIWAPKGNLYIEVTKGIEYSPIKCVLSVDENHREFSLEMKRSLNWREKGWVSADTHVHFLSPMTARFEGLAEGVNVINLLATQWGEFYTNLGDFDGQTVYGENEEGEECLVRVGTENRQKMFGHISLLGYEGKIITPITTGIPDEGPLGSPLEQIPTGLAQQVKQKNGLAIYPHYTCPQADAAAIVLNLIDGIELVSWQDPWAGINPYALSDWYRYLNCGIQLAAVGGTDKMSAETAIGTSRTYSYVGTEKLTYESWKQSIRKGNSFATYGPLVNFKVNGCSMGDTLAVLIGQDLCIEWELASIIMPVTKVELVVNGKIEESVALDSFLGEMTGSFTYRIMEPSWIAIRVRGAYDGKKEIVGAHTSTVMCTMDGVRRFEKKAGRTILDLLNAQKTYLTKLGPKTTKERFEEMLFNIEKAEHIIIAKM